MAFTTPRTWTYGETVTEAQFNEQIRDNFNAVWVGTTAGDMDYYTSSTTKTRLAGGTANAGICMRMGTAGTAPEYGGIVSYRQGGSATDWSVGGLTNYNPTKTIMQSGVALGTSTASDWVVDAMVVFPVAFSSKPSIIFTPETGSFSGYLQGSEVLSIYSGGSAKLRIGFTVDQSAGNVHEFHWIAIGPA